MKARRKGTDSPFKTVDRIRLKDSAILYDIDTMEFEQDINLSTELKTFDQIDEEKAVEFGKRLRQLVIDMTGYDPQEFWKDTKNFEPHE